MGVAAGAALMAGRHGGKPQDLRPLAEIRAILDAGPEWLTISQAADAIGICEKSIHDRGSTGAIQRTRTHGRGGGSYIYHRDGLWHLAIELYDAEAEPWAFAAGDETRTAVQRMIDRWQGCETVQQLHDDAGVTPVSLPEYDHGAGRRRRLPPHEAVVCSRCGREFERVVCEDDAPARLCKGCRVRVGKAVTRQVQAFLAWRGRG